MGLFAAPAEPDPASAVAEELLRRLEDVQIDETTPRQALEILAQLKELSTKPS
jgi:hypothetical protein